jgi:hypothetical protein
MAYRAPHSVDRVRIRPGAGPRAATTGRRLARIAGQHLGLALDRALADVDDDLTIERVVVTFPADPDELDDEAVAMLWASLVRDSIEKILGARLPLAAEQPVSEGSDTGTARPQAAARVDAQELAAVLGALQRWARDGTPLMPAELELAVARPGLADLAIAELPQPWRAPARQLVEEAAGDGPLATAGAHDPVHSGPTPGTTGQPPACRTATAGPAPVSTETRASVSASREPVAAAYAEPVAIPPAAQEAGTGVAVSSWGGLVLLHYRLRPYLERAAEGVQGMDPVAVRTAALALLVDDAAAAADPIARLIAGHGDWSTPPDEQHRVDWPDPAAAVGHAERLLHDFAGDLPGFGTSSAGFVRGQWLRRRALLLEDPPAVLTTLERRPLDLVLDRLPYPIGALRLPWTPALFIGWERP